MWNTGRVRAIAVQLQAVSKTDKMLNVPRYVFIFVLSLLILWSSGVLLEVYQGMRPKQTLKLPSIGEISNPTADPTQRPCSLQILRDYYRKENFFPGDGHWNGYNFQPKLCSFVDDRYTGKGNQHWRTCLLRANISHVVVLGDSNGQRYFKALVSTLKSVLQMDCRQKKSQVLVRNPHGSGYVSNRNFFRRADDQIVLPHRPCHSCQSALIECTPQKNGGKVFIMEYLAWYFVKETTVFINSSHFFFNETYLTPGEQEFPTKMTSQMPYDEFIFRYHLRDQMPSHLVVLPPFNHIKQWNDSMVTKSLKWFLNMTHTVLPPTTNMYVLSSMREFDDLIKGKDKNEYIFGVLASERIKWLNHVLFDLLKPYLVDEQARFFSFFDLWNISNPRKMWSLDGVHMHRVWYTKIISYFLQTYCRK